MNQSIIQVKNISKQYNITHQQGGYVALRDVLTNIAKSPFAFLKNKARETVGKADKEKFWALKDINFEVKRGEAIGIIGANGAGKSTLLKILTGITPPTTGEIKMRGKVASLLEVGTGFHPELTGRENIFLNGAILGMTKNEISAKFNDIVKFSGIGKFLDTPVKRYSSGMYVRLAFSVAAHMEPDILLVDEVLAVGDAEFQKKCLGKMDEVTKKSGRTILFVSHNMAAIQNLCKRCILLKDGRVEMIGETKGIIDKYLNNYTYNKRIIGLTKFKKNIKKEIEVISLELLNGKQKSFTISYNESIRLKIKFRINQKLSNISFAIGCKTFENIPIFTARSTDENNTSFNFNKTGIKEIETTIYHNLKKGIYNLILGISCGKYSYYYNPSVAQLKILDDEKNKYNGQGIIYCKSNWKNNFL